MLPILLDRRCFFKRHVIYSPRAAARISPKSIKPSSLLDLPTAVKDPTARALLPDPVRPSETALDGAPGYRRVRSATPPETRGDAPDAVILAAGLVLTTADRA